MYQHTVIVGNVGRDPELRYLPSGDPVANFSVAVNRKWTNRDGQAQEKTTWFRVNVFGRQAEIVNQYVSKGRLVLVDGEIDVSAYMAQDGTARASLELRARNVRFLGGRGTEGGEESVDDFSAQQQPARTAQRPGPGAGGRGGERPAPDGDDNPFEKAPGGGETIGEDEIPF